MAKRKKKRKGGKRKRGYVFTAARKRALAKAQRASRRKRRHGGKRKKRHGERSKRRHGRMPAGLARYWAKHRRGGKKGRKKGKRKGHRRHKLGQVDWAGIARAASQEQVNAYMRQAHKRHSPEAPPMVRGVVGRWN